MNTPVTIPLRKLPIGIQSFEKLLIDEHDKLVWRLLVHRRNPCFPGGNAAEDQFRFTGDGRNRSALHFAERGPCQCGQSHSYDLSEWLPDYLCNNQKLIFDSVSFCVLCGE